MSLHIYVEYMPYKNHLIRIILFIKIMLTFPITWLLHSHAKWIIYLERDYELLLTEYKKTELMDIPFPAIKDMISYVKVLLLSWEELFVFLNLPSLSISTASLGGRDRGVLIKINTGGKGVRNPTFFLTPGICGKRWRIR